MAWVLIGVASGLLVVVSFRRLAPLMGSSLEAAALLPIADANQLRRARLIGRAVTTAARFAPFRADCLPQAMAAVTLCRAFNVPYAAFLGASMSTPDKPGELAAHAWVRCGPVPITGGTGNFHRFGVVACFVAPHIGIPRGGP
ncbi:lasso peptide biosynthesis B2 protein [Brevundimonas sp.]|uniref:lasso peptide biosynthesis B2 protein n=1 Tax=Brevundimonas sp. TaxID=1871086 RepID=UPI003517A044